MRFTVDGRVALVTGAGRNLGRAIAIALAANGAMVVCAYQRDEAAAEGVVKEITSAGGTARAHHLDVADLPGMKADVASIGDVDILVNNAATRPRTKIKDVTPEEWDRVHATNLRGPFFLAQAVLGHMVEQGWGRVINIGGIDAYKGSVQRPHVVSSKLGLVGLSRALANETARFGVTVNTVVPGLIDTPRYNHGSDDIARIWEEGLKDIPVARLGTADDVAAACLFLASEQAGYVTGQELLVTGGAHPLVRHRARESDY
ncbi:SDR family NAD(P)-dependent oxidoreductase [Rhizomonospora bruguierae]|uniref:SDR family NAD(P)-dependent oxidoreductase n=1 Tax=Rhizomonospora bruguierae TaxID=1581705 RepID=UPI001BCD4F9B|nr:SDR family oxidoreductase [Micromonospora sp. NBRC 107566]